MQEPRSPSRVPLFVADGVGRSCWRSTHSEWRAIIFVVAFLSVGLVDAERSGSSATRWASSRSSAPWDSSGLAINDAIVVLNHSGRTRRASRRGASRGPTAEVVLDATRHILATTLTTDRRLPAPDRLRRALLATDGHRDRRRAWSARRSSRSTSCRALFVLARGVQRAAAGVRTAAAEERDSRSRVSRRRRRTPRLALAPPALRAQGRARRPPRRALRSVGTRLRGRNHSAVVLRARRPRTWRLRARRCFALSFAR